MKITIIGSLGNISQQLTKQLIEKGHQVTVISHHPERAKDIEVLNAIPAIGYVDDSSFLARAFKGADAVYVMVPPDFNTTNYKELVKKRGNTYTKAIKETGIRYVVNLSSIGAHFPDRNGPSGAFYYQEEELNQLQETHVLHLRAGMFYTNFYGNMEMIKYANIIGNNFDDTINLVMSHPHDIADVATDALDKLSFTGKSIQYVVSEERTGSEIAQLLGNAIGKPDLRWITFSDEELLKAMIQNGFSEYMASNFVELGVSIREGRLFSHYLLHKPKETGKRSFKDFATEFAVVYQQSF